MGFLSGVITGVAVAAGAAAWYMSRSGERFRDQYRVDRRLGEIGDQLEARTRDIQSSVNAQLAELRSKSSEAEAAASSNGHSVAEALDSAQATAAEVAAEAAAEAETTVSKAKKAAKDTIEDVTEG